MKTKKQKQTKQAKAFLVKDCDGATHVIVATNFVYATGEFITFFNGSELVARFNNYRSFRTIPRESLPTSPASRSSRDT